jgi:acyl-CoA synthetase (AMP-forming)/AMP-acid ligase II
LTDGFGGGFETARDAQSVFEAFALTARRRPDAEFLVLPASATRRYANGPISCRYGEVWAQVETLLPVYRAAGLGPGLRVATLLENRPPAFVHWLALNGLGVSVVPINPDYRAAEIRYLLEHSDAALVVTLPERSAELQAIAEGLPHPVAVVEEGRVATGLPPLARRCEPAPPPRETECAVL